MRILDNDSQNALKNVTLYLKLSEAKELLSALESLINSGQSNHEHVGDEDFQREVTVAVYEEGNLEGFNERSKKLIREDI